MAAIDNDKLKQAFFLVLILGLGVLLCTSLLEYLSAFLGAITLYVLLRSMLHFLTQKKRWKPWLAAIVLMLMTLLLMSIPVGFIALVAYGKADVLTTDPGILFQKIDFVIESIEGKFNIILISDENLKEIQHSITGALPGFLGSTFQIIANFLLMYFLLFFMLMNGKEMENILGKYVPLRDENTLFVARKLRGLIISNSIVIPMLGFIQAIAATIGYWIFGIQDAIIAGLLTGIASIVPVVGTTIVWIPLALFLFSKGMIWQGIGLTLFGGIIILNIDNVARFVLQKKIADVHPIITVFGVILGVKIFGFLGLIFGPILISLFVLLLEIYREEFLNIPVAEKSSAEAEEEKSEAKEN